MSSEEGKGIGRCVLVLVGSRSGGHIAEVLDAVLSFLEICNEYNWLSKLQAFNPIYPVIATCGVGAIIHLTQPKSYSSIKQDRAVKIWHIPYFSKRSRPKLLREDKPLFSSCMIHKARIISVNWFVLCACISIWITNHTTGLPVIFCSPIARPRQ